MEKGCHDTFASVNHLSIHLKIDREEQKTMNENTTLKDKLDELFLQDPQLADYPIEVVNNNGFVTLTGEVPTRELSDAAEKLARETDSVITLINEIVINREAVKTIKRQLPTIPAR